MADIKQIAEKIKGAENILVALSKNPSVDEVSAALGLTLMLDKIGKKATAIYSGETPDVLKFLSPEKTFSTDTNALQDFIIALDKDKADHLRYKVDGDFVKVFITPYREAISESDLEYSYGDFNVDLIVALDVAEEGDLDRALAEYGRIMHDAGVVNITTQEGGRFSEMEWSNPSASSVSEMVTELMAEVSDEAFEKNSATALLTGIVASTERFANDKTTPETMGAAAKLMSAGADQKLIAENIERVEEGKEPLMLADAFSEGSSSSEDALPRFARASQGANSQQASAAETNEPEEPEAEEKIEEPVVEEKSEESEPEKPVLETPSELVSEMPSAESEKEETKVEEPEMEETETPVAEASEPEETKPEEPVTEEGKPEEVVAENEKPEEPAVELPKVEESANADNDNKRRSVNLQPSVEAQAELEEMLKEEPKKNELLDELNKYSGDQAVTGGLKPDVGLSAIDTDNIGKSEVKDYSQMMAEALEGDGGLPNPAVQAAPAVMSGPEANHIPEIDYSQASETTAEQPPMMQNGMLESTPTEQPAGAAQEGMTVAADNAAAQAPGMVSATEGMTEDILPPPPAPPVDGGMMPPGAIPSVEPVMPVETAPAPVEAAPEPAAAPAPIETPSMAPPVTPVVPVVPTAPAPDAAPAEAPAQQVGPTPTNDDPTAFRIPGI